MTLLPRLCHKIGKMMSGTSGVVSGQVDYSNIPLIFLKETSLFGDRKPTKPEWVTHSELYMALSDRIKSSHITGLQRVGGLWRIYVDNLQDKVKLMAEGVNLRVKTLTVLNTNPQRLDGEDTLRIRVKNIPSSADDGMITRGLTLRGADVINVIREKLRINGKLTNCETGDRLITVKASSLKEPLPSFVVFDLFKACVFHAGQKTGTQPDKTCSKCLKTGHKFFECENDWVCRKCELPGHRQVDCPAFESCAVTDKTVPESAANSETDSYSDEKRTPARPKTKSQRARSVNLNPKIGRSASRPKSLQQTISNFISMTSADANVKDTPNKHNRGRQSVRSPPTPVEVLHEKTTNSKHPRK